MTNEKKYIIVKKYVINADTEKEALEMKEKDTKEVSQEIYQLSGR